MRHRLAEFGLAQAALGHADTQLALPLLQRGGGDQRVAQRRVELVGHAGHQAAQGRQLVGLDQLLARLLQRVQGVLQLGVGLTE